MPAALSSSPTVRKFQLLDGLFAEPGSSTVQLANKDISLEDFIQRYIFVIVIVFNG